MDVAPTHLDSPAHVFAVFVGLEIDVCVSSEIIPFAVHLLHSSLVISVLVLSLHVWSEVIVVVLRLSFMVVVPWVGYLMNSRPAPCLFALCGLLRHLPRFGVSLSRTLLST
jgi:hypothetical protein